MNELKDINKNGLTLSAENIIVPALNKSLAQAIKDRDIQVPSAVEQEIDEIKATHAFIKDVVVNVTEGDTASGTATFSEGVLTLNLVSAKGSDGTPGADGKSAYEVAVANGYEGTEAEWLESLKAKGLNEDVIDTTALSNSDTKVPSSKLVSAKIGERIKEPTTEGSDGQVLVTDGRGGRKWQSIAGGVISKTVKIVRKSPNVGEYGTLAEALVGSDSNTIIHIFEGVYEEIHLTIPQGITIIGYGDVIIKGEYAEDIDPDTCTNNSTLECYNGATLRNLTVTAKNCRYPIHADFSSGNATWEIEGCTFIHYGNEEVFNYYTNQGDTESADKVASACSAWGGGTRGGDYVHCYNCKFISVSRAFSTHNNNDATGKYSTLGESRVHLEECVMFSYGIDKDGTIADFPCPLFVQSLDCPVECHVVLNNCKLNGYIVRQYSGACWSNILRMFNCTPCKKVFSAYGSGQASIKAGDQTSTFASNTDKFDETDEVNKYVASSSIQKGYAVTMDEKGRVKAVTSKTDSIFGIALETVSANDLVSVQTTGYLHRIYINGVSGTSLTEGNYIYLTDTGAFSATVDADASKLEIVDVQNIKL